MGVNFLAVFVAALATLPIGFVWYNPKVFGTAWIKSIGANEETMKQGANMGVIFGMSIVFAFLMSMALNIMVNHQVHIAALLQEVTGIKDAKVELLVNGEAFDYLNKYRTFKHGALMGVIYGFMVALPLLGTNALFERRGFKYIAINTGYWTVCMAVMGGIVSVWQ